MLRRILCQNLKQTRLTHCAVLKQPDLEEFTVDNEKVLEYRPFSPEVDKLEDALHAMMDKTEKVPIVIGGQVQPMVCEQKYQRIPQNHAKVIASFYYASEHQVKLAMRTATLAQIEWDKVPIQDKINIWRKAGDLMADKYRYELIAATMLGQGKTVHQAEIDAACELIDFTRYNAFFLKELYKMQPVNPDLKKFRNASRIRGFEGFIAAISPFNFTAIAGNLAYAPALMGNAVVWKPSDNAILSNWLIFKIMTEAGVPEGVVNFVPCGGTNFGPLIGTNPDLCGINFTGSVEVFEKLWRQVGRNVKQYKTYPRLVGELGGKNFHFIHPSADVDIAIVHTILSAFEYSGQKCSACSRLYCPASLWPEMQKGLLEMVKTLKIGNVEDFKTFTSAVINDVAFNKIRFYLELPTSKCSKGQTILCGGKGDCKRGYFVEPTIIQVDDPNDRLMKDEIFGPVLAVYVYDNSKIEETIDLIHTTTGYALTGAVFVEEETFLRTVEHKFRRACGNLYINEKSTGAVVSQQPFSGSKKSGTNDKAGSIYYLLRWANMQTLKQQYEPVRTIIYPSMWDD